jgi:hypothetical protein
MAWDLDLRTTNPTYSAFPKQVSSSYYIAARLGFAAMVDDAGFSTALS